MLIFTAKGSVSSPSATISKIETLEAVPFLPSTTASMPPSAVRSAGGAGEGSNCCLMKKILQPLNVRFPHNEHSSL